MSPSSVITEPAVQFSTSVECQLEAVRPVARELRSFLEQQGAAEEDVMGCELAFVEACNNAVLYVHPSLADRPIRIEARCQDRQIEVAIHDHTPGFKMPDSAALPDAENEGGRGLFIIRSIMDEVTYSSNGSGNTLIMRKRREKGAVPQPAPDPVVTPVADKVVLESDLESVSYYKRKLAENEQIISEMAEELSSCYETLSAIFRCGAELGNTNNIAGFANSLCNDLLGITESDWYVLRVISDEDSRLTSFATSDPSANLEPISVPLGSEGTTAEMRAAGTRSDVWFSRKSPMGPNDPLAHFGPDSIGLVHPMLFADNLAGTLTVGKRAGRPSFTAAEANIVHTFADFLAIQFVNARLQEQQIKHKLVSRELEIAKSIQRALLPKSLPQPFGFELEGYCEFARTVGGDFYDVVPIGDSSVLLIIADVMGKGIPAAMFAAILRSVLRAAPEYNQQPDALLNRVNRLLYEELSEVDMFITAQLVYVNFEKRYLIAASAGHCPIFLGSASPSGVLVKAISPEGIPLGILPDAKFEAQKEELPDDATLLLYTDGVTDARNSEGLFFSEERLLNWFKSRSTQESSAEQIKNSLSTALHQFQGDLAPFDDQTFLILAEQNETRRAKCPKKS